MTRRKRDDAESLHKDYSKLRKELIGLHRILVERLDRSDLVEAGSALGLLDGDILQVEAEKKSPFSSTIAFIRL